MFALSLNLSANVVTELYVCVSPLYLSCHCCFDTVDWTLGTAYSYKKNTKENYCSHKFLRNF